MVELVVALVGILVLVAGILQISSMGVSQSRLMTEARREAGRKAMLDKSSFAGPQFIAGCTVGEDGIAFSHDDSSVSADGGVLNMGIVRYAHPDELDDIRPDNAVSVVADSAFPQNMMGLVDGEKKVRVTLLPIIRELVYRSDSVELCGKAWMTWTKGLY